MKRALERLSVAFAILAITGTASAVPISVTVVGNLQSELGCAGDFQPDCAMTHLSYSSEDDLWQGVFSVPSGSWEYKAALDDSFVENYGANALLNGPNIPLDLGAPTDVKFFYDDKSHWVTDNVNSVIASLVGSFQSELGCSGDFEPDCLRAWLQDTDGDSLYQFVTSDLPGGSYDLLIAHNESFGEYYGAGGILFGTQIPFSVPDSTTTCFSYDPKTHALSISTGSCDVAPIAEPASLGLLALALASIALKRHRSPRSRPSA
jgi:hypothetical protein